VGRADPVSLRGVMMVVGAAMGLLKGERATVRGDEVGQGGM